jgi:hypothetical protein
MVLLSKGMGVQEVHEETDMLIKTVQIRENTKGQILLRLGGAIAKWAKNKFSLISIKFLWDIDAGLIRRFPTFEKNLTRKVLFGHFCAK